MVQNAKKVTWQKLRDYIVHIPGENAGMITLAGTNCYVVGRG